MNIFTNSAHWSDFDIEMRKVRPNDKGYKGTGGDIIRDTDIEAIENSLRNILGTMQGSRRMLPEFALGLYRILFEPIDERTTSIIRNYIIHAINTWDNRVEIKGIHVRPKHDDNAYEIILSYTIKNKVVEQNPQELTYILKRLE